MIETIVKGGTVTSRAVSPVPKRQSAKINLLATSALWLDRHKSRQALAELEAHELADIGLSRSEAVRECKKYFWQ